MALSCRAQPAAWSRTHPLRFAPCPFPLVAGVSVTVMAVGVYAGAVAVNVAVPVLDESAVMVPCCAVFQSAAVTVRVSPEVTGNVTGAGVGLL